MADPISILMGLAQFAPAVIKWVTGSDKAEEVAGKVIDVAKAVTGRETPDAALAAIQADPALAIEFRKAVMANELEYDRMYLADVQSARDRDVKLHQAGYKNIRASWMLTVTFIGIVGLVLLMVIKDIDANTAIGGVVLMLVGKLIGNWETAFNFEFGTTRTNKEKDETIKRLTNK
jgi:hypothetical protein